MIAASDSLTKTFLSKRNLYQQPFFQKESLTKET
jgi:hypothetical protein